MTSSPGLYRLSKSDRAAIVVPGRLLTVTRFEEADAHVGVLQELQFPQHSLPRAAGVLIRFCSLSRFRLVITATQVQVSSAFEGTLLFFLRWGNIVKVVNIRCIVTLITLISVYKVIKQVDEARHTNILKLLLLDTTGRQNFSMTANF